MLRLIKHVFKKEDSYSKIFNRFKNFTMIPRDIYIGNLKLCSKIPPKGDIVECGVWKGGMSAGIASILGNSRRYFLFDSFEGLPTANKDIDGEDAVKWQEDKESPYYFDNCRAEMGEAIEAMSRAGIQSPNIVKGWFSETLPDYSDNLSIAILRLDADWYDSTMDILKNMYHQVVPNGIIIIDDYYFWDGCSRAIHDFLSKENIPDRIRQTPEGVAYIIKGKRLL